MRQFSRVPGNRKARARTRQLGCRQTWWVAGLIQIRVSQYVMDSTWGLVKKQSRMAGAPKDSTFVQFLSVASTTRPSNVLSGNRRLQRLDYLQKLMMSRKRRALRRAVSNHRRVTSMQVALHLLMGMKKQARSIRRDAKSFHQEQVFQCMLRTLPFCSSRLALDPRCFLQ